MSKSHQQSNPKTSTPTSPASEPSPAIGQIVAESIPPADTIVLPSTDQPSGPSADVSAPSAAPTEPESQTPPVDAPPASTSVSPASAAPKTVEAPHERKPSDLQLAVLAHGQLNGMDRTRKLQDLRVQFGGLKVEETIVDMIRLGFFDNGQVLTAKGRDVLRKYVTG